MASTILKNTPIHAVVAFDDASTNPATLTLASLVTPGQTAGTPVVDIRAIHVSVPSGTSATITRNSKVLWSFANATYSYQLNGFSDNRFNTSDIVVNCSAGAIIILELVKVNGYGDSQHIPPVS